MGRTEQAVEPKQADQAEVAKHLVERLLAKGASDVVRVVAVFESLELLVDVRFVDQRVQDVEDDVDVPEPRVGLELVHLSVRLIRQLRSVLRERLELDHAEHSEHEQQR